MKAAEWLGSSALRTTLDKGQLFVVAYAPLALILAFLSFPNHWRYEEAKWFAISVALTALGAYWMTAILRAAHRIGGSQRAFTEVEDQGGEVTAYLATYLLPLLGAKPSGLNEYAAYIVYFVVLFVVFMRSERLALVNPTLYLAGYRVFTARPSEPTAGSNAPRVLVLAKTAPRDRVRVGVVEVAGCFLVTRQPSDREVR
jgi:hypothetical protein